MSSQRGNTSRSRPQKHKNKSVFKNNLHDTSHQTKALNAIQVSNVCQRCKEIIEWKIKFKVYKPLTKPRKCVKCDNKTVKKAYHIMCAQCGNKLGVCTKCGETKEIVEAPPTEKEQLQLDEEMKELLKSLPERKRRTFRRFMDKTAENSVKPDAKSQREDILNKLNSLKVNDDDDDDDDSLENSDDDDDDNDGDEDEP